MSAQKGSEVAALAADRQVLRSTVATAKKLGYYRIELDARQALAELELTKSPLQGRAHMDSLVAEARGHGLELIARRGEQLIASAKMSVNEKKSGK